MYVVVFTGPNDLRAFGAIQAPPDVTNHTGHGYYHGIARIFKHFPVNGAILAMEVLSRKRVGPR
jgi:hypothetical protein